LLQHNHHDPLDAVDVLYTQRMRSHEYREHIRRICGEILGLDLTNLNSQDSKILPVVRVSPSLVQVGGVFLPRGGSRVKSSKNQCPSSEWNLSPYSTTLPPYLPTFHLLPLKTIARCVEMNWPCLLVGSAESGCVPLLRTFSRMCGHILHEIPITPSTGSSDLIGCFEQVNASQEMETLFSNASDLVREALQVLVVEVFRVASSNSDADPKSKIVTTYDATTSGQRRHCVQDITEAWSLACCSHKLRQEASAAGAFQANTVGALADARDTASIDSKCLRARSS
jgi:hypothetical protein